MKKYRIPKVGEEFELELRDSDNPLSFVPEELKYRCGYEGLPDERGPFPLKRKFQFVSCECCGDIFDAKNFAREKGFRLASAAWAESFLRKYPASDNSTWGIVFGGSRIALRKCWWEDYAGCFVFQKEDLILVFYNLKERESEDEYIWASRFIPECSGLAHANILVEKI